MHEDLYLPVLFEGDIYHYQYASQAHSVHHHLELEFNFVTGGTATYLLDERRYDLRRHALVWLFPQQEHVLIRESRDFSAWIGVFRPSLLTRVCQSAAHQVLREPNPPEIFHRQLSAEAGARLGTVLAQVAQLSTEPDHFNAGLGYALLTAWAAYCAADVPPPSADVHPAVERAALLLANQPELETLGEVAQETGLSSSRLRALFHVQTGVTMTHFRSRQRVRRFLEIYGRGGRVSMTRAAQDAGFGSYTQFHRVFRNVMGCGPAAYRRLADARVAEIEGLAEQKPTQGLL